VSSFAGPVGKLNLPGGDMSADGQKEALGALSDGALLHCLFGPDSAAEKTSIPRIRDELL
jgi:hypothetical protein